MAGHQFVKCQAAHQRENNRTKKTFPSLLPADVWHHEMPPDHAAGQVRAHVREFRDRDQIQHVELSRELVCARTRSEINDLGNEIEKPKHVQQTEQCIGHRLQRLIVPQTGEHLPSEHGQQKKEQDGYFEIVRACRSDFGKIIETPGQHHRAADHSSDFEIRQRFVIEHTIEFPESDHSEHADQQPEQDLVTGEHDQQGDCPEANGADESQNERGTRGNQIGSSLFQCCRHLLHHLEGTRAVQDGTAAIT